MGCGTLAGKRGERDGVVKDNEKVGESTDCVSGRVAEIREKWGIRGSEQERRGLPVRCLQWRFWRWHYSWGQVQFCVNEWRIRFLAEVRQLSGHGIERTDHMDIKITKNLIGQLLESDR